MRSRDTTSYNNQSKQTLAGAKLLAAGEINVVSSSGNAGICAATSPQEVMYSQLVILIIRAVRAGMRLSAHFRLMEAPQNCLPCQLLLLMVVFVHNLMR